MWGGFSCVSCVSSFHLDWYYSSDADWQQWQCIVALGWLKVVTKKFLDFSSSDFLVKQFWFVWPRPFWWRWWYWWWKWWLWFLVYVCSEKINGRCWKAHGAASLYLLTISFYCTCLWMIKIKRILLVISNPPIHNQSKIWKKVALTKYVSDCRRFISEWVQNVQFPFTFKIHWSLCVKK